MIDHYLPGLDFTRALIARSLHLNPIEAVDYAGARWGRTSNAAMICRGAVSGMEAGDMLDGGVLATAEQAFIEAVAPMTVLGRLQGLRMVDRNMPYYPLADSALAYWVGQSKAIRVSRAAFSRDVMRAKKVAAALVLSKEVMAATSLRAEALLRRDLLRAVAAQTDTSMFDPGNAGGDITPASITYDAVSVASSGTIEDDLAAAVAAFTGDLTAAAWVMHPRLACDIALRTKGTGLSSDLGLRGGTLLGLPAIVSQSVPLDSSGTALTLVDPSGITALDEGLIFEASEAGVVEMDDAPTGASDTPVAASTAIVSLFQADAMAIKVTRRTNWDNARPGGVVVVTGCDYSGASA
jgi:HK97 family phage major capsid protein